MKLFEVNFGSFYVKHIGSAHRGLLERLGLTEGASLSVFGRMGGVIVGIDGMTYVIPPKLADEITVDEAKCS